MHRLLSAWEITDIIKHDTSFAVCLFPVANSALFVQNTSRVRVCRGISGIVFVLRLRAWVQIAAVAQSGNSLRQTVHTHRAFVHQAAKLVAALLRVVRVTAGLAESNGSRQLGL